MKKFFKRKIVKYCLTVLLIFGVVMSAVLIASDSCASCSTNPDIASSTTTQSGLFSQKDTVSYLKSEYTTDDYILFAFNSQKTTEIEKATYSIDNKTEVTLKNVSTKKNGESAYYYEGLPDGYIFTKDLSEGSHIINFYVYQNGVKKEVVSKTFKIVAIAPVYSN